ncbi:uncharacterized protein MYCFIDRAFT_173992 [Pseudocercospora fijiensis CIRAD86]|uniref:Uncharacterized protein n=1 Tax=Pseudocercospora fijiensis (strain CIRAD86) TaxID=383855 RepID=M3B735_PSEFD|nr:uncharacterized protein MYCFIDRAFT_173992 [Pseudocercospora fijiensis CIRAD86]EME85142.1 hypothetical protein MYCFIDRAFT_173992 [Pseudocercospora fijiensis CIRAD86]
MMIPDRPTLSTKTQTKPMRAFRSWLYKQTPTYLLQFAGFSKLRAGKSYVVNPYSHPAVLPKETGHGVERPQAMPPRGQLSESRVRPLGNRANSEAQVQVSFQGFFMGVPSTRSPSSPRMHSDK